MHGPLTRQLFDESRHEVYRYSPEPFRLTSGGESHHYFNCKKITLVPPRLRLLALSIRDEILPAAKLDPVAAGGLTLGADPIAIALGLVSAEAGRTIFPLIVRKEAKAHGTGKRIEGESVNEGNVLLLDDVITTGGSSIVALEALRDGGHHITHCLCIVDREEGGREELKKRNVELLSVFHKAQFVEANG